jgi:hypothetical protein
MTLRFIIILFQARVNLCMFYAVYAYKHESFLCDPRGSIPVNMLTILFVRLRSLLTAQFVCKLLIVLIGTFP